MDIKALTPHLSISPQVMVAELEAVAQMGFKAIICNRPDGEGPDQPCFKEIQTAALALDIQVSYLPAEAGKASDAEGRAFGELLTTLPAPVHESLGAAHRQRRQNPQQPSRYQPRCGVRGRWCSWHFGGGEFATTQPLAGYCQHRPRRCTFFKPGWTMGSGGTKPSAVAMLKGREWMAQPEMVG